MKNDFWILCDEKGHYDLVIDIYDSFYMQSDKEARLNELTSCLSHDIMKIRKVCIQWEFSGYEYTFKDKESETDRINFIFTLLEDAYTWLTPWYELNSVFLNGYLILDDTCDDFSLPVYKKAKPNKTDNN